MNTIENLDILINDLIEQRDKLNIIAKLKYDTDIMQDTIDNLSENTTKKINALLKKTNEQAQYD